MHLTDIKKGDIVRLKTPGTFPYRVLDPDTTDPIGGARHVISACPLGGPPNRTHYLLPRNLLDCHYFKSPRQ